MQPELFTINGFWKDSKVKFSGMIVSSSEDMDEDDNIFYYGLSENDIKSAIKDGFSTDLEFVISSYKKVSKS